MWIDPGTVFRVVLEIIDVYVGIVDGAYSFISIT
jgi:hypothetical protein